MKRIAFRSQRPGVTLIETLVVIAIIAILVSLTVGVILMVSNKGTVAKNRQDMDKLSLALEKFYANNNKLYPPSRILLCASASEYGSSSSPYAASSLQYLNKIWPNIGDFTNTAWAGNTAIPAGGFLLEGDQCLVFFLGGIPLYDSASNLIGLQGFSNDPVKPAALGGERKRYFDFDAGRVYYRIPGNPFPSYRDQFSIARGLDSTQPFVYFSSGLRPNGYDPTPFSLGVSPYVQQSSPSKLYYQSSKYQLISSGLDGKFGPGGQWTPATASAMPAAGMDDMTNFYENLMGVTK